MKASCCAGRARVSASRRIKSPVFGRLLCADAETARGARLWNRANVLALSLRLTTPALADEILTAWFDTPLGEDPDDRACVDRLEPSPALGLTRPLLPTKRVFTHEFNAPARRAVIADRPAHHRRVDASRRTAHCAWITRGSRPQIREILIAVGEDPDRDGLVKTPDPCGAHVRGAVRRAGGRSRRLPGDNVRARPRRDDRGAGHSLSTRCASTTCCRFLGARPWATSRMSGSLG